jgi:outer membrane protein insertion porin family
VSVEDVEPGNLVKIEFNVNEDQPAHIGQIHIVGNKRTNEKVVRRELTVKPGDLYRTSEVIASQRKVANLGFFDGPTVEFADSANKEDVDLVFALKERQTGRAGVGVSSSSEKGITGFLELTEGNLFGNGQFLDLKWEFGKKNTELILGFTEPWFRDKHLSVGFDVYDTDDKRVYGSLPDAFFEDAFTGDPVDSSAVLNSDNLSRDYVIRRERRGGDVRIGWPLLGSRSTMLYGKYTLEQFKSTEYASITRTAADDTTLTETDSYYPGANKGWEWRSGITTTFVRRTTDRRYHPRLGSSSRFTSDLFGWAFGGDVEYQRHVLDTRTYFPLVWKTVLMFRGRGGVVTGFGDPTGIPNDTRFELGGVGVNGIRGYDNRSILPEGQELYGGRTMLLGGAELKFPITNEAEQIPIYGLFFVDTGNTWQSGEDTHPSDLYWGVGAGVRIELPVLGNLGIDMGYGLDPDKGGQWVVHYQFGLED